MKYGYIKNTLVSTALVLSSMISISAFASLNISIKNNIAHDASQTLSFIDLIYREHSVQSPQVTQINVLEATSASPINTATIYTPANLQVTGEIVGHYVNEHYQTVKLTAGPSCQMMNFQRYMKTTSQSNNQNIAINVSENKEAHQTQCTVHNT
jgi:hypothetical protein